MSEKIHEMIQKDGWRVVVFTIYLIICIFDFIIVPSWGRFN